MCTWKNCSPAAVGRKAPPNFPAGRYLVWSDIPNNRMMRWDETDGSVSVFREPADNSNGNTRDRQGRLVTCHHLARAVVRTEHDGSRTVLASAVSRASGSIHPTTWW